MVAQYTETEPPQEPRPRKTAPRLRHKAKIDFEIPLSSAALGILHEARRIKLGTAGYVFTTNGEGPIIGFSKCKAHFDVLMLAERCKIAAAYGDDVDKVTVSAWTIHDLMRTARSLMSQAGVTGTRSRARHRRGSWRV